MIGLEDRQTWAQDIRIAHEAGARLHLACETVGIDVRPGERVVDDWGHHRLPGGTEGNLLLADDPPLSGPIESQTVVAAPQGGCR